MTATEPDREVHRARSAYVREVVQRTGEPGPVPAAFSSGPLRTIVQFWDDLERLPGDVGECIESWKRLEARGFDVRLFDNDGAREFIESRTSSLRVLRICASASIARFSRSVRNEI